MKRYDEVSAKCSNQVTKMYSSSSILGIQLLNKKYSDAIYSVYGFVRFANEIVDSFLKHDRKFLFDKFRKDTYDAISNKISSNPVLHSFQKVVNKNKIELELIDAFLDSMEMDLNKTEYNREEYNRYIYGSAEVVALMCLQIFYLNDKQTYRQLKYHARKLGQAFQKVNFLRDMIDDYWERGRIYFPNVNFDNFNKLSKNAIEKEIQHDFEEAFNGIFFLKKDIRIGVYVAYTYYQKLFEKLKGATADQLFAKRFRISNSRKLLVLIKAHLVVKFNMLNKNKWQSLQLKVVKDKQSGFCHGVVNAVNMVEEFLRNEDKMYCLGDIVHNEEEIKRLQKYGLETITPDQMDLIKDENIMFRAHGEPPISYRKARRNNNKIIDASCPTILKLQSEIKMSHIKGEQVMIFGKKNHPEVVGLNGQINNRGIVFEKIEDLNLEHLPEEVTLYSQTTKDKDEYKKVVEEIEKQGIKLKVNNSICEQVSSRKDKLQEFCVQFDKIVFIAGKNSSNGRVLFNVCRKVNENTYFVSNPYQIKKEWFSKNEKVGICGATSTPNWLMNDVRYLLESF